MKLGALEAGGTKMVCAVGNERGEIFDRVSVPTVTPEETFPKLARFFEDKQIEALGIGCFGPIDLNRGSETYGFITTTPKPAWQNCDIVGTMKRALHVPVGFDTDVNASMLGEAAWGAARGLDTAIYVTIGTGVGLGVLANGRLLHGMQHPEGGHILLKRHPEDAYRGKCPYHGACLEGMASGPAIESRWGKKGEELAGNPQVWELESYYIAQALADYIMVLSPQKIILGGGVMRQEHMMPLIREKTAQMLNGYIRAGEIGRMEDYIVLSCLNDNQGIMGAVRLAVDELERNHF